jgi:glycosyltransferase involved in cell wall biosynthesis
MKILHVSGSKGWGGNEQQLIYCIPELNRSGVENIVFGMENTLLEKKCLENNILFIKVKGKKINTFKNYRYIKKILKERKPDLLHLHTSNSLTFYVLANFLMRLNIKTIFSKKAISASSSRVSKFKYNYKGIKAIFCVSKSVEDDFSQVLSKQNKKKTKVIPDCVSPDILNKAVKVVLKEKYAISNDKFIIGNIANHTEAKDLMTFIEVANYLINVLKRDDVVFFQIGEFSKLTDLYLEIVKTKKLENHIFFTNVIENASSLNAQFDIFLMTSQREGGPTSILEAMLFKVPVVTTRVGIVPEAIVDGVNGYVSSIGNYEELAIKINILLDNQTIREKFIENSNSVVVNKFINSVVAKMYINEYQRVNDL